MMKDIGNYSIPELEDLKNQASLLIEQKKEQAIADAYSDIIKIADSVGYSVIQLLEIGKEKTKKNMKKPVEARYRNKTNTEETWTGRGKQPRWLVIELNKGAKLEDFLI